MKNFVKIIFAAILFLSPLAAARAADPVSIAVVDVQQLVAESKAGKDIHEQLEARKKTFMADLEKQEQGLRDEQKKLSDERSSLSPDDFTKKAQDFDKKLNETRRAAGERKKALETAAVGALGKLRKEILAIVEAVSKEKGYNLVVTRQSVVIANKEADITTEVLSRLDKKISKIALDK